MPTALAIPLFLASLAVTLAAARLLARRLDRLGLRFGFPEALIGLLTAVAADGPEVASALIALAQGDHSVSVGVLVGSGAFNLAAMLGVSALLAGCVWLAVEALALEGLVSLLITLLAAGVLLKWVSVGLAAALTGLVSAVYLTLIVGGRELLGRGGMPRRLAAPLGRAVAARSAHQADAGEKPSPAHHLLALVVVDLSLIVAGSLGMVETALTLGDRWGVSRGALGVLVLAPLTSIPNAFTGIRLGLARRGAALVGETLNSNTINLAVGVILPAVIAVPAALTGVAKRELAWLVGMTAASLALLGRPRGLGRWGGALLIAGYVGFVAIQQAG